LTIDEDRDRCFIEVFDSKPLAEAFAYGLEWGDEPQWQVLITKQVDLTDRTVWEVHFEHVGDA